MTIIGVDPHPGSYTAAALDEGTGRGPRTARSMDPQRFPERRWAIEGAGNRFVAPLVADLLAEGERVTDTPPSLTSQYRSKGGPKKNDEVDATNAARALLANPELPACAPHPDQRSLQALTRTRSRLVGELKANRMAAKDLPPEGSEEERRILEEITAHLAEQVKRLEALLGELVERIMPEILEVRGVGMVLGATILAEVGTWDASRRRRAASPATTAGRRPWTEAAARVAPIGSGSTPGATEGSTTFCT